jgi:subtilisin family serine protease
MLIILFPSKKNIQPIIYVLIKNPTQTMHKIFILLLSFLFSTLLTAQTNVAGELIVRFKNTDALVAWQQNTAAQRNVSGFTFQQVISPEMNLAILNFDTEKIDLNTALTKVRQLSTVQNAYPNYIAETRERLPDDAFYKKQWHLTKIKANTAWDITTGGVTYNGDTIVIASLDSGFDVSHDDLRDNVWKNREEIRDGKDNDGNGFIDDIIGWNFGANNDTHLTPRAHSTQIAGIIGAKGNNAKGISGLMWNTKMMLLSSERISVGEVIKAYEYILAKRRAYNQSGGKKGAFVVAISSSLGLPTAFTIEDAPAWCTIFDRLGAEGILTAGATRNVSNDIDIALDVPSACPSDYLITVTNGTQTDAIANNAGFGKKNIDLVAPGTNIFTTVLDNGYSDAASGTSFASPQVAAAVGLAYSAGCKELASMALSNPSEAALWVRKSILESTDAVASLQNTTATGGRLNVAKTLTSVLSRCALLTPTHELAENSKPYTIIYSNNGVQINFGTTVPKSITLYSIHGQVVARNIGTAQWQIAKSTLPEGIYIASIQMEKGLLSEKILVK